MGKVFGQEFRNLKGFQITNFLDHEATQATLYVRLKAKLKSTRPTMNTTSLVLG